MQQGLKELDKRVAQMEEPLRRMKGLVWVELISEERRQELSPAERIVKEHYLDASGETLMIRERITHDPADPGKSFPEGSWNREWLDRRHRRRRLRVSHIFWRTEPPPLVDPKAK